MTAPSCNPGRKCSSPEFFLQISLSLFSGPRCLYPFNGLLLALPQKRASPTGSSEQSSEAGARRSHHCKCDRDLPLDLSARGKSEHLSRETPAQGNPPKTVRVDRTEEAEGARPDCAVAALTASVPFWIPALFHAASRRPRPPPPPNLATISLSSASVSLFPFRWFVLASTYKRNRMVFAFLCPAYLTGHSTLQAPPRCREGEGPRRSCSPS